MLLKEEFASNMGYLEPSIAAMMTAADELMTNKAIQDVLYMVVVTGNFLNSGGYAGDAAGVKLASLQKITDIRANKPNMNLIHYVALQAEKKNRNLLTFPDSLSTLEDASKTTVEQIHNEINALDARIKKIKKVIELPTTETEIKQQMADFLSVSLLHYIFISIYLYISKNFSIFMGFIANLFAIYYIFYTHTIYVCTALAICLEHP